MISGFAGEGKQNTLTRCSVVSSAVVISLNYGTERVCYGKNGINREGLLWHFENSANFMHICTHNFPSNNARLSTNKDIFHNVFL